MSLLSPDVMQLIGQYGYGAVALAVGIESVGIPFPGETTLLAAAIYAGSTHRLSIAGVIAVAALGAVVGDNIGFWLGREFGYRFLLRYGRYVRAPSRGSSLASTCSSAMAARSCSSAGSFAVMRALAAFLAGANRMTWPRFLVFNATGGIIWAVVYGAGAYYLGQQIHYVLGPVGIGLLVVTAALIISGFFVLRRHERQLQERAERVLPGPLMPVTHRH